MLDSVALLLSDTYKQCHPRMYPKDIELDGEIANTTRLVSYWVPRRSMLQKHNKMVFWGLTAFLKTYLVEYFRDNFFNLSREEVINEYCDTMDIQIGEGNYDEVNILQLHKLGYLPIEIAALPEGTKVPMGVPCIEITNTHPDFAWVAQWIECILQVELWKPCVHATIGSLYRELADKYYDLTVDDMIPEMACADFGMRGMSCMEEAVRCSAAWMLSFNKTSTIPAIKYIDKYYNANCKENGLGKGAVSVEHSVVGAWYAIYGEERSLIKKLLEQDYPDTSFSYVADTYDYKYVVSEVLPSLKDEILAHNGKLLIRPDSGDMVEIAIWTIEELAKHFGYTVNSKGYKVLNSKIGIIYGDGCSLKNVEKVWEAYEKMGYAANNIFFGVGAFCFTGIFEDDKFYAATRDTFGIAMKATYGEIGDRKVFIYKDPKTDTSKLKKSHKGCCVVKRDENGELYCEDEHEYLDVIHDKENLLRPVFSDGVIYNEEDYMTIRERLHAEV